MKIEHISYLTCPICREPLCLEEAVYADDGHIESGNLVSSCAIYPIINGIPRFISSQSYLEKQTVQAFGDQWNDADSSILTYGQNEEYFSQYLHPLNPSELNNSVVLDAGCGNGRLVEYALKFNPKLIVGIDYSNSVELAFKRTRHCKNVLIVQGSLLCPPISHKSFNIIYSLGVIHHLAEPSKGLLQIGQLIKDSGKIHIWTYSKEGNRLYLFLLPPLRWLARKLPKKALWFFSDFLARISWPYLMLCNFLTKKTQRKCLPLQNYLSFIYQLGFNVYKVVIHDQLAPSIAFYPSKNEIKKWAVIANLDIFHMDMRTNNSWRVGLKKNQ